MKAVTKAVIELGGEFKSALSYSNGRTTPWILYDGSYQALDDRKNYSGKYVCTIEEFQAERERIYKIWDSSACKYPFFKEWLKTQKEDDDMWMPEVGEECEYHFNEDCIYKGKVIAYHNDAVWFDLGGGSFKTFVGKHKFRPIQSEEDRLVERMADDLRGGDLYLTSNQQQVVCEGLVKKGYRKIKPMTEDEFTYKIRVMTDVELYRAGCRFLDV